MNIVQEILGLLSRVARVEQKTGASEDTFVVDFRPKAKDKAQSPFDFAPPRATRSVVADERVITFRSGRVYDSGGVTLTEDTASLPAGGISKVGHYYEIQFGGTGITDAENYFWVKADLSTGKWALIRTTAISLVGQPFYGDPNIQVYPLFYMKWDNTAKSFVEGVTKQYHKGDVWIGGAGLDDACPRWRVSIGAAGEINVSEGSWKVHSSDNTWTGLTPAARILGASLDTAVTANESQLVTPGTHYVVAIWDGGSPNFPEPLVVNTSYTLYAGVWSADYGSPADTLNNRNVEVIAELEVVIPGVVDSITQHHCEDLFTFHHTLNEEATGWDSSGYYTWLGGIQVTPSRDLLMGHDLGTYPEEGSTVLGNEYKQADQSYNLFFGNTGGFTGTAEAQGPSGTGLWGAIDSHYGSSKTNMDRGTLELLEPDPTLVGAPYPFNVFQLRNVDDINANYVPQKCSAYFSMTGADLATKPIGVLHWASYDAEHPNRTPGKSESIQVVADYDIISLFDYLTADKWTMVMNNDKGANQYPRKIEWKHPVIWNSKGGGLVLNAGDPGAADLWTGVLLGVGVQDGVGGVGTTTEMVWDAVGNATWVNGVSDFGRASGGTWDPVQDWINNGQPGDGCSCDQTDLQGVLFHNDLADFYLLGPDPTVSDHDNRYWRGEAYGGTNQADSFSCTGEVKADDFKLYDAATTNLWNLEQFLVQSNGTAEVSGTALTFYAATGTVYIESATSSIDLVTGTTRINAGGDIVPSAATYDLGLSGSSWDNLWVNTAHIDTLDTGDTFSFVHCIADLAPNVTGAVDLGIGGTQEWGDLFLITGGGVHVNNLQVLTDRQTGIGATPPSRTAGATYGATEQTMLQEAHDGIRLLYTALKVHGLVAT